MIDLDKNLGEACSSSMTTERGTRLDISELKTDVALLKKQIFGNGVKGLVTKFEDLDDKIDKLEIYMEKAFNEKIKTVLDKIEDKRRFNIGQILLIVTVLADITIGLLS